MENRLPTRIGILTGAILLTGFLVVACSPSAGGGAGPAADPFGGVPMSIAVQSSAFADGARIPVKYTADGDDVSPPLSWSGVPGETRELVLICDDPDAPQADPWVHWVVYKLPISTNNLQEGVPTTSALESPAGALQGQNSWGSIGYGGPAPPSGHGTHHYHFKVYALSAALEVGAGLRKSDIVSSMTGKVIAQGELVGTYSR